MKVAEETCCHRPWVYLFQNPFRVSVRFSRKLPHPLLVAFRVRCSVTCFAGHHKFVDTTPELGEVFSMPWTLPNCSPHAQAVIASARGVAERIGNNYIGPEHLFLAMLDLPHCGAAEVLARLGLSLETLREQLSKQTGQGKVPTYLGEYGLTPRTRMVIELAEECGNRPGYRCLRTEHLLVGIVAEGDSLPARLLKEQGVTLGQVRQAVAGS